MSAEFGFNQGFDIFNNSGDSLIEINGMISEWLDKSHKEPFFLFVHTYDIHCLSENKPPEPYRSMYDKDFKDNIYYYCSHMQDLITNSERQIFKKNAVYDGAINYVDKLLGDLFEMLKKYNVYDKSIIIITSDHGEEIGDHGLFDHGHSLYNEITHIPLIIKPPNLNTYNKKIKTITRSIDIMPTVLNFLNISFKEKIDGRSLFPEILDTKFDPKQPAISINFLNWNLFNNQNVENLIAIRDEGIIVFFHKFIKNMSLTDFFNSTFTIISNNSITNETFAEKDGPEKDGLGYKLLFYVFTCKQNKYLINAILIKNASNETIYKFNFILNSINCSNKIFKSPNYRVFSVDNISFLYDPSFEIIYDHLYSIRDNDWKLIINRNKPLELYNVKNDPKEKNNLIEKEENITNILLKKLNESLILNRIEKEDTSTIQISEETIRKLKELGYIN
jgi:hypothetical protein